MLDATDGGVFKNYSLSTALETDQLIIPKAKPLHERSDPIPYVIVADDAFPLKPYIMKPYNLKEMKLEKRFFNYRLFRARRIVENAFGILADRFQVFRSPIRLLPCVQKKWSLSFCHPYVFIICKDVCRVPTIYQVEMLIMKTSKTMKLS